MKTTALSLFAILMLTFGCGQKSNEHEGHDAHAEDVVGTSENQKLYDEVMKIHDEVMPKMNDIHALKMEFREKIEKTPNLSKTDRMELDALIARLDSAGEGMMVWMREFRPIPDSLGEEKAKKYLKDEMERVKKVRDNIAAALESAQKKKGN